MKHYINMLSKYTGMGLEDIRNQAENDLQDDLWDELEQDLSSGTILEEASDDEDGEHYYFCFPIDELKKHYRLERR